MYVSLLALFFSATALATPADTTDLATPAIKTIISYLTVTGSTDVAVVTQTESSNEDAMPTYDSEVDALSPTYPSWVESVLKTAIPTTWKEKMSSDQSFFDSEINAEASGIMPAWYSSLPSDVKYVLTSDEAVYASEVANIAASSIVMLTSTTTPGSSVTSSSSSSTSLTMSIPTSGSATLTSKALGTSTSTGGAHVATGSLAIGIAGAAGILGLAQAL
ncbi:hypothetical protein N7486_003729 [Penicillium sp. IBT 16267x]|nr:hypothetical protein N7486_003729 [Penicillium sp. IBT 16267x]